MADPRPSPADRLRLCFIVESGTDFRLVDGLSERFDVTLLTRAIPGGREISQPLARPVRHVGLPASRAGFAARVARYLAAHRQQVDHTLVQGYGAAAFAANSFGRASGVPVTMLVCSPVEEYYRCRKVDAAHARRYRRRELLLLQLLARLNARVGARYVVLSEHLAEVVRSHGARGHIAVIPVYGVDLDRFRPAEESREQIRRRLGLPTTGQLLFFSSRVAPEKDASTLLAALRRLREAGRDAWILHRSGGFQHFQQEAESHGVRDRVLAGEAVHPVRELPAYYQASDLCIQSSRAEGLGFSPLEALACGVPVVASAVGGLRETIIPGTTGWTYPPGDASALAGCIVQALDNPVEAGRRAGAGRILVGEKFERKAVFQHLERFLLSARRSTPLGDALGVRY